jgi:hypothetical protein
MFSNKAQVNFDVARYRAVLNRVRAALRRQPILLLPFEEVQARLLVRGQVDRGYRAVPLASIVGSQGRHRDFDRWFLPQSDRLGDRWKRIDRAYGERIELPPVELYKLGQIYFVRDGHHRISVARRRGQSAIDAHVIELLIDVPLSPDLQERDLDRVEEQSDFFEWTNLALLRPGSVVEVSNAGGYLELIAQINRHRLLLSRHHRRDVSAAEAITAWYDDVYVPLVQRIRRSDLLRAFPARTEADLYVAIANYQHVAGEQRGREVDFDEALRAYVAWHGSRWARRRLKPSISVSHGHDTTDVRTRKALGRFVKYTSKRLQRRWWARRKGRKG